MQGFIQDFSGACTSSIPYVEVNSTTGVIISSNLYLQTLVPLLSQVDVSSVASCNGQKTKTNDNLKCNIPT